MNLLRDASIDALRAFAEFAEDANFSRAAIRLHISQPALHAKVAKLSGAIGRPLYVSRGRVSNAWERTLRYGITEGNFG